MNNRLKNALYESIMKNVAKLVKKAILEADDRMHLGLHDTTCITTDNSTTGLKKYLVSINKKELLTAADEHKLADIIQHSDDPKLVLDAKDKLVSANLLFVITVANHYIGSGLSKEDLIQAGNIGLIEAAEKYDPSKPINGKTPEEMEKLKFFSYAVWYIRRAICTAIDEFGGSRALPRNVGSLLRTVKRVQDKLYTILGRTPDVDEIHEELKKLGKNYSIDEIEQVLGYNTDDEHLDRVVSGDGEDADMSVGDRVASTMFDSPDAELDNEDMKNELEQCIFDTLGDRDGNILLDRFGIGGRRLKQPWEIAEDNDMIDTRVNQIVAASLKKLAKNPDAKQLLQYI